MIGTVRITERGSHTWVKGTTLQSTIESFKKLGSVKSQGNKVRLTRFCGGIVRAEFFPAKANS